MHPGGGNMGVGKVIGTADGGGSMYNARLGGACYVYKLLNKHFYFKQNLFLWYIICYLNIKPQIGAYIIFNIFFNFNLGIAVYI